MENDEILRYKLLLSKNLIIYLFNILTSKSDKKTSIDIIENVIKAWQLNLSEHIKKINEQDLIKLGKTENFADDMDVLKILVDINSLLTNEITKEFLEELLENLQSLIKLKE